MSIVNLLILLLFVSGYILLVFDQNRFASLTVCSIIKSKVDYYELEGWLYYAIAFYKSNHKKISIPFNFNNINNIKRSGINIEINKIDSKTIEITVFKNACSDTYNKLSVLLSTYKNKLKIEKIY